MSFSTHAIREKFRAWRERTLRRTKICTAMWASTSFAWSLFRQKHIIYSTAMGAIHGALVGFIASGGESALGQLREVDDYFNPAMVGVLMGAWMCSAIPSPRGRSTVAHVGRLAFEGALANCALYAGNNFIIERVDHNYLRKMRDLGYVADDLPPEYRPRYDAYLRYQEPIYRVNPNLYDLCKVLGIPHLYKGQQAYSPDKAWAPARTDGKTWEVYVIEDEDPEDD
eukprot:NODE_7252_length_780_cov_66.127854_g7012_i0.p1 GENE.NODE_7252_length_780_cov_66.127854_g7012_i0~~NODE_7252_length_780_cov_66.127854_g7012_i0.p1  ORF type:complete len:241 (-),score=19.34 NODE_7252_length_780_cov_66.127854_g7012_i0:56-733(-)